MQEPLTRWLGVEIEPKQVAPTVTGWSADAQGARRERRPTNVSANFINKSYPYPANLQETEYVSEKSYNYDICSREN
jgi:hypothetical protein